MEETIIPIEEPKRQGYFISCLNDIIQLKTMEKGRQPSYKVVTFGCQMNARDSEKLAGILTDIGYIESETEEEADLVLFNTCTVRENANERLYGRLGQLKRSKKNNKDMLIGLCGCMMQEAEEVEKIKKSYSYVDIVFGTHNIYKLAEILYNRIENKKQVVDVIDSSKMIVENLPSKRVYPFKSGVNITFGCNNFCTFCIVPYVRGRERSVPLEEIVKDVEQYVSKGAKEIVLLGQNVNSYGKDFKNGDNFAKLLEEICKVEGDYIVRFVSPHPRDFTDDVIDVIAKNDKISKCLHLPLQSGSSQVLRKMGRGYTKEKYLALVDKIKSKIPDVALTADIIVGFPGETEEDFLDTVDVVEKVSFDNSYMFMYSIRKGTKAATMDNQIDENVKKERLQRLMEVQNKCSFNESSKYKDKVVRVLVEGPSKKNKEVLSGRTSTNKIVLFKGDMALKGQFVDVKINECKTWTLYGDIV